MVTIHIGDELFDPKSCSSIDTGVLAIQHGNIEIGEWVLLCRAARLAALLPNPVFAEVGVWKALTAKGILQMLDDERLPEVKYVGVDPERFSKACWEFSSTRHKTEIIPELSTDAAKLIPNESLAWCFIDACHCEECATADSIAWIPKIAPGGFLAYHDTNPDLRLENVVEPPAVREHLKRPHGVAIALENTTELREGAGIHNYSVAKASSGIAKGRRSTWTTIYRREA